MSASESKSSRPDRSDDLRRPWLGLKAFGADTQHLFFGRSREIRELSKAVQAHTLTVLYGQSGRGKTSLLGAGLLPCLRRKGFRPSLLRLGFADEDPVLLEQVYAALEATGSPLSGQRPDSLWEWAHQIDRRADDLNQQPLVLVFDQFEEVFTLGARADGPRDWRVEVECLLEQLADLIENRPPAQLRERLNQDRDLAELYDFAPSSVRWLLALREDFLADLESWSRRLPSLMRNRIALRELDGPNALDAVVKPGELDGAPLIDQSVGRQIVCFVAKRPPDTPLDQIEAVPPLLSLLCHELNEARIDAAAGVISADQVALQSGDILQAFYERSFADLPVAVRSLVEDRLLTVGGHRSALAREDAVVELQAAGVVNANDCLDQLLEGRLLSAEDRGGIQRLELTHDVLAPLVLRSRDARRNRERAERAEQEHRKARRERNRFRLISALMSLLVLISGGLSWFSWQQMTKARVQTARIEFGVAQRLMAQAETYWAGVAQMADAVEMGLPDTEPGLATALLGAVERPRDRLRLQSQFQGLRDGLPNKVALAGARLSAPLAHEGPVSSVAFSPDGRWVLTGSRDNTARVWDASTSLPVSPPLAHAHAVTSVAFSPDGRWVVTGSEDNTARVWEASTGAPVSAPLAHEGPVYSVAFSPDGRWVVTGSWDDTARVWEASTGAPVTPPLAHEGAVFSVAFSPDGRWVVTGSERMGRVWEASTGNAVSPPLADEGAVFSVAFSPDGRWVLTGSNHNMARVWEGSTGNAVSPPLVHEGTVDSVAFSPDGRWVLTGSDDNRARLWDVSVGAPVSPPLAHEGEVSSVAFSPDGRWVLTGSLDDTAKGQAGGNLFGFAAQVSPLLRQLLACTTSSSTRIRTCAPKPTIDVNELELPNDPHTRSWLRYYVLGDPAQHPSLLDTSYAGKPLVLRQHMGGREKLLAHWWQSTGYLSLGSASALAQLKQSGNQEGARETLRLVRQMIEDSGKPEYQKAIYLPSTEEVTIAQQDLRLVETLLVERGTLRLGGLPRVLWNADERLVEHPGLAELRDAAGTWTCARGCGVIQAAPAEVLTIQAWPEVHRSYLSSSNASLARIVEALFDHVPTHEEAIDYRKVLEALVADLTEPDHAVAEYSLARLLDDAQGGGREGERALQLMLSAAEKGIAPAQNFVGYAYLFADQTDQDIERAERWLTKAAEAGEPSAMTNLGLLWMDYKENPEEAIAHYRRAISSEFPDRIAMRDLASILELGLVTERNQSESRSLLTRSAELGNDEAQYQMAIRLEQGAYGAPDPTTAMHWYASAAIQGHPQAAYRLGQMYEVGIGDQQHLTNAAAWYRLAGNQGHLAALYALAKLVLEDPELSRHNSDLAASSLQFLGQIEEPPDPYHDLHWVKGEAGLLPTTSRTSRTLRTTGGWEWPTEGTLASTFLANDPARQGLKISGRAGQFVKAAKAGEVVYSGSGLVGYGELIIVKHNGGYLSAYGHNRKRLVEEGDKVETGQVIAELGRSGTDRAMLHFEIRVAGNPIDPLGMLPIKYRVLPKAMNHRGRYLK